MLNHPKDRHVLAAAVASDADFVVTANVRDFPSEALASYAIEVSHPDDFLCDLYDVAKRELHEVLTEQAAATGKAGRRQLTVDDVLNGLIASNVTRFAHRMRQDRRANAALETSEIRLGRDDGGSR